MIKPTLLVKLLKVRLAEREALLTRQETMPVSDSYTPTHTERLEKAHREAAKLIVQNEVTFLKTVLKEAAQSTHDYSP